jgi:hypothetical protein
VLRRRDDGHEVSDDPARLDLDTIHGFLPTAYWSPGVSRETVERSVAGSLPMGLYAPDGTQAGYARAVTDRATFAYMADVFVLPEHRAVGCHGSWYGRSSSTPTSSGFGAGCSRQPTPTASTGLSASPRSTPGPVDDARAQSSGS